MLRYLLLIVISIVTDFAGQGNAKGNATSEQDQQVHQERPANLSLPRL